MVNPYRKHMNDQRQHLIDLLEYDLLTNSGFVRIHAAEVLCEHGFGFKVAPVFEHELGTTVSGYRVGVWRVMARIAAGEAERRKFTDRIRGIMLDGAAPDRLGATESLAKLGVASRADRPPLEQWLTTADDATAPFPLWLLLHSSTAAERPSEERRLARLVDSAEPIARLRSSFALGRLENLEPETVAILSRRAALEPADSPARVYLFGAAYLHAPRGSGPASVLREALLHCLKTAKPHEQFEAATVLGLRGGAGDIPILAPFLKHPEADARIGTAGALLRLLQ